MSRTSLKGETMKVFTRSSGSMELTLIDTNNRPLRIEIDGVSFDVTEEYGMLKISQIEGLIIPRMSVGNVIFLDPRDGKP